MQVMQACLGLILGNMEFKDVAQTTEYQMEQKMENDMEIGLYMVRVWGCVGIVLGEELIQNDGEQQ